MSTPGSSVLLDAMKASVATTTAATNLPTRALPGDERAHTVDAAGVEHMLRLDPAAPRGAHAETHLPPQQLRPMAVAVDRDPHARRSVSISSRCRGISSSASLRLDHARCE